MIPVRAYFNLLTKYLRPLRWRALALGVVLLVAITLQLLNPQIVAEIIDRVTTGTDVDDLVPLAVAFMVIAVAHQLLAVTATWLAEYVGWSATNELRAEVTEHVLELDMGFHKAHTPGELIERIDGDVIALSNFFSALHHQGGRQRGAPARHPRAAVAGERGGWASASPPSRRSPCS